MTLPQGKYDISTLEKLLFRRQFILGPHFIEDFPSWKRIKVRDNICLTVHPDLNAQKTAYKDKSITLLGYILDPYKPQATDSDIVNDLVSKLRFSPCLDCFFEYTESFGGRWILLIDDGRELRLFTDAAGHRQVFYSDPAHSKDIWCASQPGTIAEVLHLAMDEEAQDFINDYKKTNKEYWWPGDSSPYIEIKHLLPNHYLDIVTGQCYRHWPRKPLDEMPLQEAVNANAVILKGLMHSAVNRFDLALSITAGRDTRLLLAASKDIRERLYYFTGMYWHLNENSPDIVIASRLLSKVGLKHNIIKSPAYMEDKFKKVYHKNVVTAHEVYGTIAQGLHNSYPQDKVCVKGNTIPIGKCHFRERLNKAGMSGTEKITADILARLTHTEEHPFAIKAYKRWLAGLGETYDIDILDLFYWEDRDANWQAMSQLEWDIVQEVFVPFNCRSFLANMLAVDQRYRKPPEYKFHEVMISTLWPELLTESINPRVKPKKKAMRSIVRIIKNILVRTHLYQFVPKKE